MEVKRKYREYIYCILLFLINLGIYFEKFYINVGFALKPYMIVLGIVILVFIAYRMSFIRKILLYEQLYLIFILYSIIRGYFSIDKISYFRLTIGLIVVITFYIFVTNIVFNISENNILNVIYLAGIIFMTLSLILYIFMRGSSNIGGMLDRGIYRLTGTIFDPNIFTIFISLIYSISLHMSLKKHNKYIVSLILSIICIFFTFSRGGWMGIIFITLLVIMKTIKVRIITIIKVILFILGLGGILYLFIRYLNYDIVNIFIKRLNLSGGSGRITIWINGINIFKQYPIFGIGLYNFRYYQRELFMRDQYMHNTFLEILVENGIIGFLLFVLFLIRFMLEKDKGSLEEIIKITIYGQFIMLLFLSGIINEFIYFTFAIYKGIKLKCIYKHKKYHSRL